MTRPRPYLALVAVGCAWGLTLPLMRVAVSTGHAPFGIVLWQQAAMAGFLGALLLATGRALPRPGRHLGLFLAVALLGSLVPGYVSYVAAAGLPAGVRAIIIAIVPMFTLPIAIACGYERPDAVRAAGVLCGAAAIVLIALPEAALPGGGALVLVLLALLAPLSYGVEANYLAWRGGGGLDAFQLVFGASMLGACLALPLAAASGSLVDLAVPWGPAEWAILASALLNALAYSGYVHLVAGAGAVFASQVAYLVTAFGVLWSMALLGERYGAAIWSAFALMLAGLTLVRPRRTAPASGT